MPINSLASPFDQEEDVFSLEQPPILSTAEPVVSEPSVPPYYGVTSNQRSSLNEEALTRVENLPKNEFGQVDLSAGYKDYSDKLATGDLSFLKDAAEENANIQSGFQYGLTPEQQEQSWSQSTTGILGEAVNNLNKLKETNPQEFESTFQSLTPKPALAFLYDQAKKGEITKEEHAQAAVNFLRKQQPDTPFFVENGKVYSYPANNTSATPHEIVLTPDNVDFMPAKNKDEYFYNTLGTMSKKPSEDFDVDAVTGFVNNPVVSAVGMFLPPVALATTAMKVAAGIKLTPMEIVSAGLAGLNAAGITRPPTGAGAGGMGPVDTGTGLFGTTYNQTQTLLRAAAADNLEGGIVQVFAPTVIDNIKEQLPALNIPPTGLPENFEAGLTKTVEKMAGGASFEDAIKAGGIEYIRKGGLKPLEDIVKNAVQPLGSIADPIKDTLAALDKNVLQPITKPVGDVLSKADTAVRQQLSEIDDAYLQPVTKPVGDVLSAADTAVRDALPSFGSLGIDLPNISLGMLTGGSTLSPTRTTDDIFKEDLFKLKTKIGISPVEQLLSSPTQQQQEVVGLYEDPFASSFDERNTI